MSKVKIESHYEAANRAYEVRRCSGRLPEDESFIRLRGYTELAIKLIPPKMRKKLDSALKRGYALEYSTALPELLRVIEEYNPVQLVAIGYIGKNDLRLFMPTKDEANDLCKELKAITVLTDAFEADKIMVPAYQRYSMYEISAQPAMRKGSDYNSYTAHLKSCFKEMRPIINDWMATWARPREAIAEWVADDSVIIRIPFDTHREKKGAT